MIKKITFFLLIGIIVVSVAMTGCKKDDTTETPPEETNGTLTDSRDGKIYNWKKIGNQIWMTENLAFKEAIGCWAYSNDENYVSLNGYLYDWNTAMITSPDGWHLPSDNEWKELEMYLGMSQSEVDEIWERGTDEGKKLKSISGWDNGGNGNNASGFNAFPSGNRESGGDFYNLGSSCTWWSSTEVTGTELSWKRYIEENMENVGRLDDSKTAGYSVRCIKNN